MPRLGMWWWCWRSDQPRRGRLRRPSGIELSAPCLRGFDQCAEDGAGGFVLIHGTLGVPLHGNHEVICGSAFQSFDDAVVGTAGGDAQAASDCVSGLMIRRGYRERELVPSSSVTAHDFRQLGISFNLAGACYRDILSRLVIHPLSELLRYRTRDM